MCAKVDSSAAEVDMGSEYAQRVARDAAAMLSSGDRDAESIVAGTLADVVRGHDRAAAAFDAFRHNPWASDAREAFVAALATLMAKDTTALDRVQRSVASARDRARRAQEDQDVGRRDLDDRHADASSAPATGTAWGTEPSTGSWFDVGSPRTGQIPSVGGSPGESIGPAAPPPLEHRPPPSVTPGYAAPPPSVTPGYAAPPLGDGPPPAPGSGGLRGRLGRMLRRVNPFSTRGADDGGLESLAPPPDEAHAQSPPPSSPDSAGLESAPANGGGDAAPYPAYPYLRPKDQVAGQEFLLQPEAPFVLDVGLNRSAPVEWAVVATPASVEVRTGMTVHVHLSYDPASFTIDEPMPIELQVTADDPYPRRGVTVTPLPVARPTNRRIAAHYLVDGKLRGIAFRTFRDVDALPVATPSPASLVDLTPLADEEAPDIVLAIYGADAASPGTFTMAAYPRDPGVAPPELGRIDLGAGAGGYMREMFKEGNRGAADPTGTYDKLTGIGWRIGAKIPTPIFHTLKAIAEAPDRDRPATMLLLTEESAVPWELAALGGNRDIQSAAGGSSPFLGAHFAIGRWPIAASTTTPPVPDPRSIEVHQAALVRADYEGVGDGWRPLDGAKQEVAALVNDYIPAIEWTPLIDEVKENLFSEVDVIHFALHGQVDGSPGESGLVLLRKDGDKVRPAYLSADEILGLLTRDPGPFPRRPFVFLNACQVGQGQELLGDYAGLAAAMIEAGARAVVACIWNVNDGIAGSISREFYRRADTGESPAEILRSVRTRYVRPAPGAPAPADPTTASVPTLIAYQYFGHPGMRVLRTR